MLNKKIPIIIGVTGHRDLRDQDVQRLKDIVESELGKLINKYPNSDFVMLNSLATGGDTLCGEVAINLGIKLVCPLPMEVSLYQNDFKDEDLIKFNYLLSKADEYFVVDDYEPFEKGIDFKYRQADIYVATKSHLLLALWDGSPAKEKGCGTNEAVDFMLNGVKNDVLYPNNEGAVLHISTPRKKNNNDIAITAKIIENQKGSLAKILEKTDNFNKESDSLKSFNNYSLLNNEVEIKSKIKGLEDIYNIADNLSLRKQRSYIKILKNIATISVLLVLCYLLYDEASLNICLIGFGVLLTSYALFYYAVNKINKHESYLEYRALSESMRVQYYLSLLNIHKCVCDFYTWTQQLEFIWIKKAVNALTIGKNNTDEVSESVIKKHWIDEQLKYHTTAIEKDTNKYQVMKRVTQCMLTLICLMYIVVLVLEYGFNNTMNSSIFSLDLRTIFKIAWGCTSAVTVFISAYYGKMSLERKLEDHEKMILLFKEASSKYDKYPKKHKDLFINLAKEEIIENGNWVSYCKENKPDFNL